MPQNPQNTINQNALKYYNQFRSVITEYLRWVQITTDIGMKVKVGTTVKEIHKQVLAFITIYLLNIEQQDSSSLYIITIPINPIIISYFNKHFM